ncbi:RagB/SusD family nutrient uptake outer membrane protein [Bacteroides oleiciplenus]|uniref:RagB/SusD domain-containing protein n=1 Tax=Bacteroides oleiciplenus YIT 12058 TaxID=742727 RepID=K9E4K2_9BACE|nr:RagB/SusD family nutrient uptake outer membrane protein [Bacteroides oleiciplenus]EKU90686.1 hypothetical protein HMPREF9447_02104 [Bacteroides oleiciplenus YIT 12058]
MKKIIYLASFLCTFIMAGCDDFLTLESPDLTTEKYWRDQTDIEAGLSAVYSQLDNRTNAYSVAEIKFVVEAFRSDEMITGADVNNYPEWDAMYNYTYNNENARIKEYWMNNYNGINYANNVLDGIEKVQSSANKMTTEVCDNITGETLFLRAYYHFKLILNWEKIIIRDEFLQSGKAGEEQVHKALSSRMEAWDFICKELDKAVGLLPQDRPSSEAGRVTKSVAYAYLGWAYLTRAYEESSKKAEYLTLAEKALKQVTGYELESNYESMFNGTNRNCKESIFELQFTNSTDNGTYHKHVLHYWFTCPNMWGWDEIRISPMMYNEFLKEGRIAENSQYDARAYASMYFDDPYYADGGRILGYDYSDIYGPDDDIKYNFKKYLPTTWDEYAQDEIGTNLPLMRYSNVLLMLAEVFNEQQHPENAIPLINDIRRIHGKLPAMKGNDYTAVKAQIEHERLVEFAMENYRFYDLRRWGKLEEAMRTAGRTNFVGSKHSFLPIPLMEIQSNNKINAGD